MLFRSVSQSRYAVEAAKQPLLTTNQETGEKELNYHPKAWEIQVVYLDHNDLDENNQPKEKMDTLDNLFRKLANKGYKVKKSTLKAEDIRKTYREERKAYKELIDKYLSIFGAFKQEQDKTLSEQLDSLRTLVTKVATEKQISYLESLDIYLNLFGDKLRPELRQLLTQEVLPYRVEQNNKNKQNLFIG